MNLTLFILFSSENFFPKLIDANVGSSAKILLLLPIEKYKKP